MASYKTILLCYDGSREGRKALRCGADLAIELGAQTHLLAVVDLRASVSQSAGFVTDLACAQFEQSARDVLSEGVAWLSARGVSAQGHFAHGVPVDEIAHLAGEIDADLVVVGHRCRRGLARWWSGSSSSASLLDRLSCSLLVTCSSVEEQRASETVESAPEARPAAAVEAEIA